LISELEACASLFFPFPDQADPGQGRHLAISNTMGVLCMTGMRRLTVAVLAVVILGAAGRESLAQVVPYKASGSGDYSPSTGDYGGAGHGTHVGKLTFFGNVATEPAGLLKYTFQSTVPTTTVAANGDTIVFTTSGTVQLIPLDSTYTTFSAVWTGEFVVIGGTGRFANVGPADRPLRVTAINDPFTFADPEWTFSWDLDGSIVLH
jgi:hypothetical protein